MEAHCQWRSCAQLHQSWKEGQGHRRRSFESKSDRWRGRRKGSRKAQSLACQGPQPRQVTHQTFGRRLIIYTHLRTFAWSPSNKAKKEAWVPVVPLTPRKPKSSLARWRLRKSHKSSWIQRVARLPTVVSWAGWKWVKPRVGRSRYCLAKLARREITVASFGRRMSRPSRRKMRSALLSPN